MKYSALILAVALCCHPLPAHSQVEASAAYAPDLAPCPSGFARVREAGTTEQTLSAGETTYVSARTQDVLPNAWKAYLAAVDGASDSLPSYVSDILGGSYGAYPTLGIATSGGGYRAATFGAGVLNALDGRNSMSVQAGTGGLLQAATYLAGLSGGSWLVTSLAQANFPTLPDLVLGPAEVSSGGFGGWVSTIDLLEPDNSSILADVFFLDLVLEIMGKHALGFPVTVTDVWARTLSRHFVNGTTTSNFWNPLLTHGAGLTFSSISELDTFVNLDIPFPIVVTDSLSFYGNESNVLEGQLVPLTNPIYEVNVYEFGSYDPMLAAFTPTQYLGTVNDSVCVTGFDQISFIEAISSNLFNDFNTSASALANSTIGPMVKALRTLIPEPGIELAVGLVPNPFYGVSPETFIDSNETLLQFVDGGEDGEVVPFMPLLVKARDVDVIFAIDAASDTEDNYADGSSIVATQDRVDLFAGTGTYSFPPVPPEASTFLAQNLTKRPTFFGCNSTADSEAPLVIYLANGGAPLGQTPVTNTSTWQFTYSDTELDAMLSQTFDIATQGIAVGGEKDPEWPACLACAVVDRARRRENIELSGLCRSCLSRYCWS